MINRITGVDAPGDGRRATPGFFVPDPADRSSQWSDLREKIGTAIGDHPIASLAIGLAVGIVIGCLAKRR